MVNPLAFLAAIHPLLPLLLATSMLGICAGVLGCFALLRGQSLFGDAMAHASLPGIALVYMFTQTDNPALLLCGGSCASALGALLLYGIRSTTTLKTDAILGSILSFFFGTGLMLMTIMQRTYPAQQAILGKFLFGNAALLLHRDIAVIIIGGCFIVLAITLFWKELISFAFDTQFTQAIGYSTRILDLLLTTLMILLIGIGMQTVGVILITTLLIAPAAAARQWTKQVPAMACVAAIIGIIATISGAFLSYYAQDLPTGPTIVLCATLLAFASLFLRHGKDS
jgi:manganese/zinc/iron transport system permease protein